MSVLTKTLSKFLHDERGATAIEYAIILGLMTLAIIAAISSVGDATRATFEKVDNAWNP